MTKNNNVRGMRLNHIERRIEVSKRFLKMAGVPDSVEAVALYEQINKFPTYTIKEVVSEGSSKKESYKALSIERMIGFVNSFAEADVNTFESYIRVYLNNETGKLQKGKYATIKSVFLERYEDEYKNLKAEDIIKIDEKVKELIAGKEEYTVADLLRKTNSENNLKVLKKVENK